jgi:CRP-like cAMP-binding protein
MLFELLDAAVRPGGVRELRAGDLLFRRGDPALHLFVVRAGMIRLQRCTVDGREVLMGRAARGETLCEAALTSEQFHCDAVAAQRSVVGAVDKGHVLHRLRSEPEFAVALAAAMAEAIRSTRGRLELRNVKRARERLLQHLLLRADRDREVRVESTFRELASELGLTHESLYRELSALAKEGVIARRGKTIRFVARV